MKHKVAELEGNSLDAAVAMALGQPIATLDCMPIFYEVPPVSSAWAHGGPIIERERITVQTWPGHWAALWYGPGSAVGAIAKGSTPLIAAMRAYVAAKLGDEVELP